MAEVRGTAPSENAVVHQALEIVLRQSSPMPLDVQLVVPPGRLLAMIGPSGAGKTTILRTVAGLYKPTDARIACNGVTWLDTKRGVNLPPHERRTGLVFQSYALFPHLTVEANVMLALGHLPAAQRGDAASALLTRVHLEALASRKPHSLSGGEQQRVALARALARDPQVLLLDEPFSAIDRRTRRALKADIGAVCAQLNIPIVLVTHDLDDATTLADDVAVIDHGRVLQTGPLAEVRDRPATDVVRDIFDLSTP